MSLKNIYTSVNGFLPDLLTSLSIQANFRLTYQKHKMSQRTVQYMLKVIIRVATKPLLKQLWARLFHSLINYHGVISPWQSNSYPKSHKRKCWNVSPLIVTFVRNKFPEIIRIKAKTLPTLWRYMIWTNLEINRKLFFVCFFLCFLPTQWQFDKFKANVNLQLSNEQS